jgi:pentatricopeptide repeat domain-containing protein 1
VGDGAEVAQLHEGSWIKAQCHHITFSAVISACEKGGQWEMALKLLSSMKSRGLEPDDTTINDCIEYLHAASEFNEAAGFMIKARGCGCFS